MKNTTNKKELSSIRKKLKDGEFTKIAERVGYSRSYVSNVLAGRRTNAEIVKAAKSITAKRK